MVKHIVFFKLKSHLTPDEKAQVTSAFKSAIEALPAQIPFIRRVYVSGNINPAEQWDIVLESEFDTLQEVKAYSAHPAHIAAAGILKEAKADRACVDFEA
jgi:hypothetical protein